MIRINGDEFTWKAGMTVRDVILDRNFRFPLLIVRIDGILVPRDQYDTVVVPDNVDMDIIHLMSGG